MAKLSGSELRAAAQKLINAHREASEKNQWTFFVDELYASDCVYTCEYAGTMLVIADGIDEIKATHYGRDMQKGWEGWTFPYQGVYVGADNRVVTHWLNRGPGLTPDGGYYQTPGISFLTFNAEGRICRQFDMFDLAHQMHLCDELEDAGLLSAELKQSWVLPMKEKLQQQLARNT
ncbi:MAG: nuclear transport factor 2 family protein [Gammaproteobacteria bacterium]|nr:nuclear transport factor 2 family protein [Gammaproteobacteria bacterium]